MESPGEYLKRERELRGISITHIFEGTRVPLKYLEALEADNYGALPHPTFVRGFIRTYCKCLGVDENDAVLRYDIYMRENAERSEKAGKPEKTEKLQMPRPQPAVRKREPEEEGPSEGKGRSTKVIPIAVALLVVIVGAYFIAGRHKTRVATPPEAQKEAFVKVESAPAKPEEAARPEQKKVGELKEETHKPKEHVLAEKHMLAEKKEKSAQQPQVPSQPATAQENKPVQAKEQVMEKKQEAAPQVRQGLQPQQTLKAEAPKPAAAEAKAPADQIVGKKHTLVVDAKEVSWIQLKIDDAEPFDVVLREGERIVWKAANGIALDIGNAGGVNLTFDGAKLPQLGASGEVVHMQLPAQPGQKAKEKKPKGAAGKAATADALDKGEMANSALPR